MLPFLEEQLLNLVRCREGKCYFQRGRAHPPSGNDFHDPVKFKRVAQKNGRTEDYLYVTDAEGILSCAASQTVEFHGWGSRASSVETPDRMVFDLDPGEGVSFVGVKSAALQLRRSLEAIGVESFPLLTGGKGIHVVVPLTPEAEWARVRDFAKIFCSALAEADPKRFTIALLKAQRQGRIFLDYLRNQRTATGIMPYSARARDGAPVAAPLRWAEVAHAEAPDAYSIADASKLLRRAERHLEGWEIAKQSLPQIT